MIKINYKEDCVGCCGCQQICPKSCISMIKDEQGFLYPQIDEALCIECRLCEKVCPINHQDTPQKPIKNYAAKHRNEEVRLKSSSGGVFSAIAEYVLSEEGVVFGVKFNENWLAIHSYTESYNDLYLFRGSKYMQSHIGSSYLDCQTFLKQGRKVLFTGTPCQVAGLKNFLRKEYDNLLTVDFICHGVPSPMIWKDFLNKEINESLKLDQPSSQIDSINFRDKRNGWEEYGLSIKSEGKEYYNPISTNQYMHGFLKNLYLRPSCYKCPSKEGKSHSDITLADFWDYQNVYTFLKDSNGISWVMVNSDKGFNILNLLNLNLTEVEFEKMIESNRGWETSSKKPENYINFWRAYPRKGIYILPSMLIDSLYVRIKHRIRKTLSFLKNHL